MHTFYLGLGLVIGTTVLSIIGMLLVRKFTDRTKLGEHHDVGSALLSVIGTLFAVLLALVVVDATNNVSSAITTTEMEANSIADVFRLSVFLPNHAANTIQEQCRQYVHVVIDDEWEKMEVNGQSEKAQQVLDNIWNSVRRIEPVRQSEQAAYQNILTELGQVGDCRRTRLLANENGVSPLLWAVLITGAIATVVFTYFFAVESLGIQLMMTALMNLTLALNLFLVAAYAYPFIGDFKVQPKAFMADLKLFDTYLQSSKKE
jgi:hypothetical protein